MPALAVATPTAPPIVVKPRAGSQLAAGPRPAVPPKPPIDTYRYSQANMEGRLHAHTFLYALKHADTPDTDLDALLNELTALENQLNASTIDPAVFMNRQPAKTTPNYHNHTNFHNPVMRPPKTPVSAQQQQQLTPLSVNATNTDHERMVSVRTVMRLYN
jgi:hypothetical protein